MYALFGSNSPHIKYNQVIVGVYFCHGFLDSTKSTRMNPAKFLMMQLFIQEWQVPLGPLKSLIILRPMYSTPQEPGHALEVIISHHLFLKF